MTDEGIFVPESGEPDRPTDYIANPVRVQLRPELVRDYGRPYQRIDVLALANSIVARETECRQLRESVTTLLQKVAVLESRLAAVESVRLSGRLVRALEAFADVMADDDEPSDYPDREV